MTALGGLTWPEASALARDGAVLAVPVGSTEQHGPHLPLSTDSDLAVALCQRLAAHRTVVIAPALPYGSSGEHAGFPGTLSIGQAAVEQVLVELVRSATDTFARVLLVSGHGGNAEPAGRAVATLRAESRDVLLYQPSWDGDAHAGRVETALQLALRPWLVGYERAEPGNPRPLAELLPALRRGGVRAVSPNGILGDPSGATAAEGSALLATLTTDLIRAFDEWMSWRG